MPYLVEAQVFWFGNENWHKDVPDKHHVELQTILISVWGRQI